MWQIFVQLSISNKICHFTLKQICYELNSLYPPGILWTILDPHWPSWPVLETDLITNIVDMVHICVIMDILLIVRAAWWVQYNKMAYDKCYSILLTCRQIWRILYYFSKRRLRQRMKAKQIRDEFVTTSKFWHQSYLVRSPHAEAVSLYFRSFVKKHPIVFLIFG